MITYEQALSIARDKIRRAYNANRGNLDWFLSGQEGSYSGDLSVQVGANAVWFRNELWDPEFVLPKDRKGKRDSITIYDPGDPDKRFYRFSVRDLWREHEQGAMQATLFQDTGAANREEIR